MTAIEYLLTLADWQLFGSLTWSDSQLGSVRKRQSNVDEFLRERCTRVGFCLSDLPLVIRWERGEQTERPHCHFLLSGLPETSLTRNECYTWNALWFRKYGLARVRLYDPALRAEVAEYMTPPDPEWVRQSDIHQANRYERHKFDLCDSLTVNDAAWSRWQRLTGTSFNVARCT